MANTRLELLKAVEKHMKTYGLTAIEFGVKSGRGRMFVYTLRDGRSPTVDTLDLVENYMRQDVRRRAQNAKRKRK